jgi:hypothetical protein
MKLVLVALAFASLAVIGLRVGIDDLPRLIRLNVFSALPPAIAAAAAIRARLRPWDTASWAIPSWFCLASAMALAVLPASVILWGVGLGLPALMMWFPRAQAFWYRTVLNSIVRTSGDRGTGDIAGH